MTSPCKPLTYEGHEHDGVPAVSPQSFLPFCAREVLSARREDGDTSMPTPSLGYMADSCFGYVDVA